MASRQRGRVRLERANLPKNLRLAGLLPGTHGKGQCLRNLLATGPCSAYTRAKGNAYAFAAYTTSAFVHGTYKGNAILCYLISDHPGEALPVDTMHILLGTQLHVGQLEVQKQVR